MPKPTTSSLLSPKGRIEPRVLWPKVTTAKVEEKLSAFITDGWDRGAEIVDEDARAEYATEWAYGRSFDEVHSRLLVNPSTVELANQGSSSWLLTQIQDVKAKAEEAYAAADAILADAIALVVEAPPPTRESACTVAQYVR